MATKTYDLVYTINNQQAIQANAQMIASFQAVNTAARAAQGAINGVGSASTTTFQSVTDLDGGLTKLALRFLGFKAANLVLSEVKSTFDALDEAATKANDLMMKLSDQYAKFVDKARELAAIEGKSLGETTQGEVQMSLDTLANVDEVRQFSVRYKSMMSTIDPGQIDPQTREEIGKETLKTAISKGVNPDLAATMIGGIIASNPQIKTTQEAEGHLESALGLIRNAAFTFNEGAEQVKRMRGAMQRMGFSDSYEETVAYATAASPTEPAGRIGTRLTQLPLMIEKLKADPKHAQAWEEKGLTGDNRRLIDTVRGLKQIIEDSMKPGGGGPAAALLPLGIKGAREVQTLVEIVGDLPFLERQLAQTQAETATPQALAATNLRRQREVQHFGTTDPGNRRGAALKFASDYELGKQNINLKKLMDAAESEMQSRGEINTPESEERFAMQQKLLGWAMPFGYRKEGGVRKHALEEQAMLLLGRSGIDMQKRFPDIFAGSGLGKGIISPQAGQGRLAEVANEAMTGPEGLRVLRNIEQLLQTANSQRNVQRQFQPVPPMPSPTGGAARAPVVGPRRAGGP